MNAVIQYIKTNNMAEDICRMIEEAQDLAFRTVDATLVLRNWYIGKRINVEVLEGEERAEYGARVIRQLSNELTARYGRGYSKRNLYQCLRVYRMFPEIVHETSAQLDSGKVNEPRAQSGLLPWTHYRILTQVEDANARNWYAKEAYKQMWSSITLQRNVSSQYYYRLLKTQGICGVQHEMQPLNPGYQNKLEFIKNPVIAEFLGMQNDLSYYESDLEQSIIDNLQKFLMELGKGYAFVARQQHIHTDKEEYYIDLVFYNYILKCFVLIDLKTKKITHQDVGQMDMYIRMYDELKKSPDDKILRWGSSYVPILMRT